MTEQQNKPNWDNAPAWANWLAMDSDGEWYWYEKQPIQNGNNWEINSVHDKWKSTNIVSLIWSDSLETRSIHND